MKIIQSIFFFILPIISFSQEVKNIRLLDNWQEDTLIHNTSMVRYSGCWGFVYEGKEYAAIGSTEGTHFFLLNENDQLVDAGFVDGKFNSASVIHREIKTFGNYAYAICDEGNSSLQIIDLSYLPDSVVKVADLQDDRFGKIHNLFIDTTNALLYTCLVTPFVGGIPQGIEPMRVFSLNDPLDPVMLWQGPNDIPEVHDVYVRDNIAILNCAMDGLRVYDFDNPSAPIHLSSLTFYQDQGYNHQGWLTPDGKTYIFADETTGKKVKKCEFTNDYSLIVKSSFGTEWQEGSISHNIMCSNEFAFIAYYNEGLRIFDLRYQTPKEIAAYDTYPQNSTFKMNGAWGVYSEYPSGRIIISDRQNGLFLFDFDRELFTVQSLNDDFSIYPNPIIKGDQIIVRSENDQITDFDLVISDNRGRIVGKESSKQDSYIQIEQELNPGVYHLFITYTDYLGDEIQVSKKINVLN